MVETHFVEVLRCVLRDQGVRNIAPQHGHEWNGFFVKLHDF